MDLRTNSDYFPTQHWRTGFYNRDGVCLLRGMDWIFICNSTFCPHSVFMCFVWIWEQTAIISLYIINRLVFITETSCLLRGTDWIFIYNPTFCPHSVFVCFVWIWEETAIISLYSINWLVFITETECVYCAVRTGSLYIILRSAHTVYFCFVWTWEQTAIISLYTINWSVYINETECLVRGTDWVFVYRPYLGEFSSLNGPTRESGHKRENSQYIWHWSNFFKICYRISITLRVS